MSEINSFSGDYRFLSNFFPCSVSLSSIGFKSIEHAYQAAKFLDSTNDGLTQIFDQIRCSKRAGEAKHIANAHKDEVIESFHSKKVILMTRLIYQKFSLLGGNHNPEHAELACALLATGNDLLVEGNNWGDTFWGVCDGVGKNILGEILRLRRESLKHELSSIFVGGCSQADKFITDHLISFENRTGLQIPNRFTK